MKATEKKEKNDNRKLLVWLLLALIVGVVGWLGYLVLWGHRWNRIELDLPENDDIEGEESIESTEVPQAEIPLYYDKFEAATSYLDEKSMTFSDYLVVIDISEQKEYVFRENGTFVSTYRVSTGATSVYAGTEVNEEGVEVPKYENRAMEVSIWRVKSKIDSGLPALYGARMMMLDRLIAGNWVSTEVALHGTNTPDILGSPESLGCIYHENADIIELYEMLEIGSRVVAIE